MIKRTKPLRLFCVGFPKSGTSTLQTALMRSGITSAHWHVDGVGYVGSSMYKRSFEGLDPLADFSAFEAITQADLCKDGANYWPQFDPAMLIALRHHHPDCWFVLNYREPEKTARSIERWSDFQKRLVEQCVPGLPKGRGRTRQELVHWINGQYKAVRWLLKDDPKFLEYNIEDDRAKYALGKVLNTEIKWWGRTNKSDESSLARPSEDHAPKGTEMTNERN